MIINEKPYWWDAKSPTNSPDIPWETKADIVIVGCGLQIQWSCNMNGVTISGNVTS